MRTSSIELFPFFVYGTLRARESNFWRVAQAIMASSPATLSCARLFDLGAYPMALEVPDASERICGEILVIAPDRYVATLRALDALEGAPPRDPLAPGGLFHRARRVVANETGECVEAWVYFGRADLARRGHLIASGDWKTRSRTISNRRDTD